MSEVAGRIAVFSAAETLLKHNGGMGLLFCGVPGVAPARVLVLGGGVVGLNSARMAMGLVREFGLGAVMVCAIDGSSILQDIEEMAKVITEVDLHLLTPAGSRTYSRFTDGSVNKGGITVQCKLIKLHLYFLLFFQLSFVWPEYRIHFYFLCIRTNNKQLIARKNPLSSLR